MSLKLSICVVTVFFSTVHYFLYFDQTMTIVVSEGNSIQLPLPIFTIFLFYILTLLAYEGLLKQHEKLSERYNAGVARNKVICEYFFASVWWSGIWFIRQPEGLLEKLFFIFTLSVSVFLIREVFLRFFVSFDKTP